MKQTIVILSVLVIALLMTSSFLVAGYAELSQLLAEKDGLIALMQRPEATAVQQATPVPTSIHDALAQAIRQTQRALDALPPSTAVPTPAATLPAPPFATQRPLQLPPIN